MRYQLRNSKIHAVLHIHYAQSISYDRPAYLKNPIYSPTYSQMQNKDANRFS